SHALPGLHLCGRLGFVARAAPHSGTALCCLRARPGTCANGFGVTLLWMSRRPSSNVNAAAKFACLGVELEANCCFDSRDLVVPAASRSAAAP
ncbi:MAG: hypothetical protein ACPIOQ_38920, partial [Promethearchaeia archaeon]